VFKSLRCRLILSFVLIVLVTLLAAGAGLIARLGGYKHQQTASTQRSVAAPVYYNLTLRSAAARGGAAQLRTELVDYLRGQEQDSGVTVLLIDSAGNVIPNSTSNADLSGEHFDVLPPPARGPSFGALPEQTLKTTDGSDWLYVTVSMPRAVRVGPSGISEIVVALPKAEPRAIFRDIAPRMLFAGIVGLVAAVIAGALLWASLYRPMERVTRGIRAVAGGRYDERVPVSGPSEVRELAEDVNAMAESVQDSQRTLQQFLANVSHELKTPLTSIRGFAQAMMDGTLATSEERERAVRVIDAESRRVLHLVEELLDLTRIESGRQQMELAEVSVDELLSQTADVFAMRATDAGVTLTAAPATGTRVLADFDRVEQVLGNLVDNAFRHTPRGGAIAIGVERAPRGMVEISVSDTGSGIAPDDLPHVFERFYRSGDEPSGSGSGLGLAIAREIVRAHGGEIRAEAGADGGSVFAFTLRAAAGSAAAAPRAGRRGTEMHVTEARG
jgi:signal transduction histidine kinase